MSTVYWTMKGGKKISIDDMDITHLRNSLKMVVRAIEKIRKEQEVKSKPKFELRGDIAQDHYDTMMQNEFEFDMGIEQQDY